jgi:hypothetical protein
MSLLSTRNNYLGLKLGYKSPKKYSFASHDKAKYWNYEKNKINPENVPKDSNEKYWFDCHDCKCCSFELKINDITADDKWCPLCELKSLPCIATVDKDDTIAICNKPSLASSRNSNYCSKHAHTYRLEKPEDCPICLEKISEETERPLSCGHWIHKNCFNKCQSNNCPICRSIVSDQSKMLIFYFSLRTTHPIGTI